MTATQTHRVFILSHPRTACHVFFQLLASHPIFQVVGPFCCAAAHKVGTEPQTRSKEEWQGTLALSDEYVSKITWQTSIDGFQRGVAEAELGAKWTITMDHPHLLMASSQIQKHIDIPGYDTRPIPLVVDRMLDVGTAYSQFDLGITPVAHPNPTLLPDRFLFSFTPIIMIRHPARVIPSSLRVFQRLGNDLFHPDFPVFAESFRLVRLVFDSFKSLEESRAVAGGRKPNTPIVIDGDKLVGDPRGQMKKLCALLGIDDSQLEYSWDPSKLKDQHCCRLGHTKFLQAFVGEFIQSTGVFSNPRLAEELNIEEEVRSWTKEWDEDNQFSL